MTSFFVVLSLLARSVAMGFLLLILRDFATTYNGQVVKRMRDVVGAVAFYLAWWWVQALLVDFHVITYTVSVDLKHWSFLPTSILAAALARFWFATHRGP